MPDAGRGHDRWPLNNLRIFTGYNRSLMRSLLFVLACWAILLCPTLTAQNLTVTLSSVNQVSRCGPLFPVNVTVANNSGTDFTDVTGSFDLPGGIFLETVTPAALATGNSFDFGDIAAGQSVSFTADFQIGCGFAGLNFVLPFMTDGTYTVTTTSGNGNGNGNGNTTMTDFQVQDDGTSGTVEVVFADLSMPSSNPAVLGAFLGLVDDVTVQVVNNSFGELEEFTYCVTNTLTNLDLQAITIGGVDITAGGPAFTENGQDCYTVTNAAIMGEGLGATFSQGEQIFAVETWEVVECVDNPDDITRRVQYGCQGDRDCQEKGPGDFITTGVSYDLLSPEVNVVTVSQTRPACYVDDPTEITMRLTNEGNSPARNIRFRIETDNGRGMTINTGSVTVTDNTGANPFTDITGLGTLAAPSCNAAGTVRRADFQLNEVDLQPGESILVSYTLSANCDCNSCDIRNKYYNVFSLRGYDDNCNEPLNDFERDFPSPRFDAFIQGIAEGPPSLFAGQEGCINYFVTNMQLDWLSNNYPESYLEATFVVPCGLDYVAGTMEWTDRDGQTWPIEAGNVTYVDQPGAADDNLVVRWEGPDRPSGFNIAAGANFEFCVVADCTEKPNLQCGNAFTDVDIEARFDFTTDPNCAADCAIQKVWAPQDLQVRVVCPSDDPLCACDGIRFLDFDVVRNNFGLADADNDQVPDGPMADPATAQTDRFLQGDSLRATFNGRIQDEDDNRDFDFGFIELPIGHPDFTPIGASVVITDASTGQTFNCGGVPFSADYVSNRIIADFSRDALNNFGCGLPAGFLFENNDEVELIVDFVEKRDLTGQQFRIVDYEPRFYVSEDGFGQGVRYQCNPLLSRMTQVGIRTEFSSRNADFGSCDQPNWEIRYDRYIGGASLDEFPNEIRVIGLPDRLVFNKPSEFSYRLENWQLILQQRIEPRNTIVNTTNIPAEFFVLNGDEVTFLIGDYLATLTDLEIPPDEGYRVFIRPRIQGGCESVVAEYDYDYQFFEAVDENIFCTSELARSPVQRSFDFTGAARLQVVADQNLIRLCSGNEQATIRVRNVETSTATNAFLFPEAVGQVVVNRVEDAGTGAEILPNPFGIYELGNIAGRRERVLNIFFTKNTCENNSIDFIAGWDCNGYPETIDDAVCRDPSSINLSSAQSNVDMVITAPPRNSTEVIELCENVPFEANIVSSDLGFVRDLFLNFAIPPNLSFEPGSFQIAVPSVANGGTFVTTVDPTPLGGNNFEIDIASLNDVLNTQGLIGAKDVSASVVSIRFNTTTECGYLSGERAVFRLSSSNSCGDPLPNVIRESGRIRTSDNDEDITVQVQPARVSFNPCSGDSETLNIKITLGGGPITNADSVRVLLPEGLSYIAGSYAPGTNAPTDPGLPVQRVINGQNALFLPLDGTGGMGNMILFDIDIEASDVAQSCGDYRIAVDAFAAFDDECNGVICQSAFSRGSDAATAVIQKPDIEIDDIIGTITLTPGQPNAVADFSVDATNLGFPLIAGNNLRVSIYDDVNGNGSLDPGTDVFLFPLDTLLVNDLGTGESINVRGMTSFPASGVCTVIGVIEPDETCVCSTRPSATFRPDIIFDIPNQFGVCSNESVDIGPDPIPGYDFRWLSVDGSDLGNLSSTTTTPTTFTAPANNTGAPLVVAYNLRAANAPCFTDERVEITVAALINETVAVNACLGSSFTLPTVADPEAMNFSWSPTAGLTITDNGRIATIDNVSASATYTLTYDLGDAGCPASLTINLTAEDCGTANTQVGDFVWFDLDEDGLQDAGEPGVSGVTVYLINANTGSIISTAITDANGMYLFDELPAGNYAVQVVPPGGFVFTTTDAGNNDGTDSDIDPATGITSNAFVPLGEVNLDFDAGFVPDCTLELDFAVGECTPTGNVVTRRITLSATWTGNPYTYDQFNDGNDTLDVTINGNSYALVVSDLDGTVMVFDSLVTETAVTSYTIDAAFRESTTCTASTTAGPFNPCIYDLALTKVASTVRPTPGPYAYGDLICMDLVVENQGQQPVTGVQLFDRLPAGMAFNNTASDLGWIAIGSNQLFTLPGSLAAGDRRTVTLCANLQMAQPPSADAFTNSAEISGFSDAFGNNLAAFDEDSTPDQDPDNDNGGVPDGPTDNITNGDPNDPAAPDDEDDDDPFRVAIFDISLTKEIVTPPPYLVGDVITYSLTVMNSGNEPATNTEVTDYIPAGMSLAQSSAGTWSAPVTTGGVTRTTRTIAGPIAPASSEMITIDLIFNGVAGQTTYNNRAEISDDSGDDVDGTPDDNPGNDDPATDDDTDDAPFTLETVAIGSTVFLDPNDNGMQDPAGTPDPESGIPGVTLSLFLDANNDGMLTGAELTAVATTMTGANGDYYFGDLLPGVYQVSVDMSNFDLAGGVLSGLATSSTDVATSGNDDAADGDDNGMQPGGPFAQVTSPFVTLVPGTEPTNETGSNGGQDVANGLPDANGNMTVDFGFIPNVAIGSTVFFDPNDNGLQDAGETGIGGVTVQLLYDANNNGVIDGAEATPTATVTTTPDGNYIFADLPDGNYQVVIPASNFSGGALDTALTSSTNPPSAALLMGDNQTDGDDNGTQAGGPGTRVVSQLINLMAGMEPMNVADDEQGQGTELDNGFDESGDMTIDFGFIPNVSIGSTIFLDQNLNSMQDGAEVGIEDVLVELYFDANGDGMLSGAELTPVATQLTGPDGEYFFGNLTPGSYQVRIPASNFAVGGALNASQASSADIPGVSDADSQVDGDDNGLQDSTGRVVVSPFIDLQPNAEPTDAGGGAAGAVEGGASNGLDNRYDAYGDLTVDFGFQPNVSIGSTVFLDPDDSGTQSATEAGIPGAFLELFYDADGSGDLTGAELMPVAFDTTEADGRYFFGNLAPGGYVVQVSADNFVMGMGVLSGNGTSSTDPASAAVSMGDNQTDGDDNGVQMAQFGTVTSMLIILTPGAEPENEAGSNGDLDVVNGGLDANGDMTIDFGFVPNVAIGSTIFYDPDDSGTQDAGENGIAGVTVELYYDANGNQMLDGAETTPVATQMTDASGNYFFSDLPSGFYQVQIPASNFSGGALDTVLTSSTPTVTTDEGSAATDGDDNGIQSGGAGTTVVSPFIDLQAGMEPTSAATETAQGNALDNGFDASGNLTIDFGFQPNVAIGSTVFFDVNNDAVQNGGETGIAGVRVELFYDADGDSILSPAEAATPLDFQNTDAMGNYYFDGLVPGNYLVQVAANNFADGAPLDTALTSSTDIASTVLDDRTDGNDNGVQPGGFGTVVSSPLINLASGQEPTALTGEDGQGGTPDDGIDASGDLTIDFGFAPNLSIGSTVFLDNNNNALFDLGTEEVLENVTVELYFDADGNGTYEAGELVGTDVTDGDGNFYFDNLPPGNYQVQIPATNFGTGGALENSITSSSDIPSSGRDGNFDNDDNGQQAGGAGTLVVSPTIALQPATEPAAAQEMGNGSAQDDLYDAYGDMTVDFGFQPNVAIGSTIFFDANNDGEQNTGEPGIMTVIVELYFDADGNGMIDAGVESTPIASQPTDAAGNYYFENLVPGNYQVQIPASNFAGGALDTALTSSTNVAGTLLDNQNDGDDNGDQPAGFGTTVFSPIIELMAGTEPIGTAESDQGNAADDAIDASGDMTVDFGFVPNVSIGSTVFIDNDNTGTQMGADETGIQNVLVELYFDADADGTLTGNELTPVASQLTGADGEYYFDNLPPGSYQVQIPASNFGPGGGLENSITSSSDLPSTAQDGQVDGDDNGIQVGGAGTLVVSPFIDLSPGAEPIEEEGTNGNQDAIFDAFGDLTIDFGFQPNVAVGSTAFADFNDNGVQDDGEPGITGVIVELYFDANGDGMLTGAETTPVMTQQTDGDGNYYFENLVPGAYQVQVPVPTQFTTGGVLQYLPSSSTDIATTADPDNDRDGDDNGLQAGGSGTVITTPFITLTSGDEPGNDVETEQGNEQDNALENSGNMTLDLGFVCNLEIIAPADFTICLTKDVMLREIVQLLPPDVNGNWMSTGTGQFLDANGDPVAGFPRYDQAVRYRPSQRDALRGPITLTLVTDAAGICPPVTATVRLTVLNVDCGGFFWNGRD